ncbi:PLD nuclease N-terminal domain-containing protein [Paenibacillus sp. MMS18-CY102]|uniref:PLD nuclease N-terminal domain-containing protein n=1 Tax=Paenibacillus sp. MMS18-CY102 TaxID=2682849 RepID=UPI0013655BF0|nr:PLD nuclease N-terminal domain-containing protein [Paenibacillus sp. MMS18-CY102]MWC30685.1 transcriptional regulator [Paenibacillus sp. MMS18-CY102]
MNTDTAMSNAELIKILAPLLVIQAILMVIAIVMLVRAHSTRGPKWLWALIIIFINIVGPVLFFVIGRKNQR